MQHLIGLEILLKGVSGLVLLLVPMTACGILGLPKPQTRFWPRLLGGVLVGVAAASYVEIAGLSGLGLAGSVVINLIAAGVIFLLVVLGNSAPSRRGRLILGLTAGLLVLFSLVEIAHV